MPIYQAAVVPPAKAKRIPLMGEQPILTAGEIHRPPVTPNLRAMSQEPFSFPVERMPKPSYNSTVPRPCEEADLIEFFAWGMPRFLRIYPRAREELVRPWLMSCMRLPTHRFMRTAMAFGLFYAERTPWEPELAVYDQFVVARAPEGSTEDKVILRAGQLEAPNIWREGLRWAEEIGAVTYQWGQSTGIDLEPVAKRLGYDYRAAGYVKVIRRE